MAEASLQMESFVLKTLEANGTIADSGAFVEEHNLGTHNDLVGVLKSLESYFMIELKVRDCIFPSEMP
jgi:hypothetical protein